MINLRYHVVSLTAVFLALAIGVAMGTGFLNKATVDTLKRQIRSAEGGIDEANARNEELRADLDRAERSDAALLEAGDLVVGGRLSDVAVLVVASEEVDDESLDRVRTLLVEADADLRGTLTVSDRLRVDAGDDPQLAELVGSASGNRAVVQSALTTAFAAALVEAADRPATSEQGTPDVVRDLIEANYVGFEAPDLSGRPDDGEEPGEPLTADTVLAGGGVRYLFVSGPDPRTPDADFLVPVLRTVAADGPAPVVLASAAVGDEAEETRTAVVGVVRGDPDLRDEISTVDDLERLGGLLSTVWALQDLDAGIRGHYGIGAGAQAETPGGT